MEKAGRLLENLSQKWPYINKIMFDQTMPNCHTLLSWIAQTKSNKLNEKLVILNFAKLQIMEQEDILLEMIRLTNRMCKTFDQSPNDQIWNELTKLKEANLPKPSKRLDTWKIKKDIYMEELLLMEKETPKENRPKLNSKGEPSELITDILNKLQISDEFVQIPRNLKNMNKQKLKIDKLKFIDNVGLIKIASSKLSPRDQTGINLLFNLIRFKERDQWVNDLEYKRWLKEKYEEISKSDKKIKEILLEDLKYHTHRKFNQMKRNYNQMLETSNINLTKKFKDESESISKTLNLKNDCWIDFKDLFMDLNKQNMFREVHESSLEVNLPMFKPKLKNS